MSDETPKIVKTEGKEPVENPPENKEDAAPIEYTQVPKETASTFAKRSISIMLEYPIYFALCIVGLAALDSSILQGVLDAYNVQGSLLQQNTQLVSVILTFMGLNLLKVLLVGPLLSMMIVYLGFAFTQNKEVSPYSALNFILRNYKRLFVPFLIAQLCIQIGMVVVIPGVLFMMQYAFVDAVTCIEKNPGPLTRSRKLTRALRGSLLAFIIPWALFSQLSGLVILQFSDNFLALTSLNVLTQALYTFIMCAFFSAYEYRSYKLAVRRADKEGQETPERPLKSRKINPTIGLLVGIAINGLCFVSISSSLNTQNYISCVDTKVQDAFKSSSTTSSTFNASSVCESAKKTCNPNPPCEMACNITKYNLKHPKDMTKPYTIQGAPNIGQCTP